VSRIGKHPVPFSSDVKVEIAHGLIETTGKLGALKLSLHDAVDVQIVEQAVVVRPRGQDNQSRMMWGTTQRRIKNMITGVTEGFKRELEINGVGYRASVQGKELVLQLGYSHDIRYPIPVDVEIKCPSQTSIILTGIDKVRVGQIAAEIRSYRKPEPYKGKGVKYANEKIYRKEGKKK
jgi:large subunit ribosomal protein L6